jgi:predicted transcriptional regulator
MIQFLDLVINFSEKEKLKLQENRKFSESSDPKQLKDIAANFQYALRIENLNLYFRSLKKSSESLSPKKLQLMNILALIDATLLGSGAERVSGDVLAQFVCANFDL